MSALRDSVIIKLLFVKLSCIENTVYWQQLNLYQCLKGKILYGYKVKATIYYFTQNIEIFVCYFCMLCRVTGKGQFPGSIITGLSKLTRVKTYSVQSIST